MAQLPINKNKRQTHTIIATTTAIATATATANAIATIAASSAITLATNTNSITNNQMLDHKLKYINNRNHQINERVIIKTTTTTTITTATTTIAAESTTSSCKCLNNNNNNNDNDKNQNNKNKQNNNNKNKCNKNMLRKVKSMPNLIKHLNKIDIINYDDNDNHHCDNGNDNDNDKHKNFNYYHYKQKSPTLNTKLITTAATAATTNALSIAATTTTTIATLSTLTTTSTTASTTIIKSKENHVKEMLTATEISIEDKQDCCIHYKRNVMLVTPCCNKLYKCRFCHDENEMHRLECKSVTELICIKCQTRQIIQEYCENCGIKFGKYTCLICNLFDDLDKQQYHCDKCGICRVGGRENFFHCLICNICLPKHLLKNGHRCIENISRSHCPICLMKIHTSRLPCYIPPCGHLLHNLCFEQLLENGFYKCPICQMSLLDMTVLWEFLDLQQKLMPTTTTTMTTTTTNSTTIMPIKCDKKLFQIFCNDCLKISRTKFHVIGLKCLQCGSYNTTANNNKNNNSNNNNINDNHNNSNSISNNHDNINNLNNKEFTLLADEIHST